MTNSPNPPPVAGLSDLAPLYGHLLCDVWGVVHNGVEALPEAGAALARFRRDRGRVLLITNAPRRKAQVIAQLDRFGVDRLAYDDVLTSGEATREYLAERSGAKVFHLGPERDVSIYEDLAVTLVGADDAELIVCTGLFDDEAETPDDYAARLAAWTARGLPMLCANPDVVVERGDKLVWCAGALADRYRAIGGPTLVFGKPHPPVYAAALARFAEIVGAQVPLEQILAIGDGLATDIRGANQANLDVLFITGGIHAEAFGDRQRPDSRAVHDVLAGASLGARAFMPRLAW